MLSRMILCGWGERCLLELRLALAQNLRGAILILGEGTAPFTAESHSKIYSWCHAFDYFLYRNIQ